MEEIDDESEEIPETTPSPQGDQAFHTSPNTPDQNTGKEELMQLSAHAVEGTTSIATFSLLLMIEGQEAVALVDSGSSHTFMDYKFALKSNCHLQKAETKKIAIAGGGHLLSEHTVQQLNYSVQGHKF